MTFFDMIQAYGPDSVVGKTFIKRGAVNDVEYKIVSTMVKCCKITKSGEIGGGSFSCIQSTIVKDRKRTLCAPIAVECWCLNDLEEKEEFYWREPGFGGSKVYLSWTEMLIHAEVVCGDRHGITTDRLFHVGGCEEYYKSSFVNINGEKMFDDNESGTAYSWWVFNKDGNQGGGVELSLVDAQSAVNNRLKEMLSCGLLNRERWDL